MSFRHVDSFAYGFYFEWNERAFEERQDYEGGDPHYNYLNHLPWTHDHLHLSAEADILCGSLGEKIQNSSIKCKSPLLVALGILGFITIPLKGVARIIAGIASGVFYGFKYLLNTCDSARYKSMKGFGMAARGIVQATFIGEILMLIGSRIYKLAHTLKEARDRTPNEARNQS